MDEREAKELRDICPESHYHFILSSLTSFWNVFSKKKGGGKRRILSMSYLSSPRAKLCMQFKRRVGFLQLQVGRIFLSAFACSSFPAFNLCPYISLTPTLSVTLMTALCIHIPGLSFYPGTCQEKKWDTPA